MNQNAFLLLWAFCPKCAFAHDVFEVYVSIFLLKFLLEIIILLEVQRGLGLWWFIFNKYDFLSFWFASFPYRRASRVLTQHRFWELSPDWLGLLNLENHIFRYFRWSLGSRHLFLKNVGGVVSQHSVGLAGACLSIHEDSSVNALQRWHDDVLARAPINLSIDNLLIIAVIKRVLFHS